MTSRSGVSQPQSWDYYEARLSDLLVEKRRGTIVSQWKYRRNRNGDQTKMGPYLSLVLTVHDSGDRHQAWFYIGKRGNAKARQKLEIALNIMQGVLSANPDATNRDIELALREVLR